MHMHMHYTFTYTHAHSYMNTYAAACAAIHKCRNGALFFTFCAFIYLFFFLTAS